MFSELIDTVITRSGRLDRQDDIISYANQTMREVQATGHYYNNMVEDQIEATADPFIWTTPPLFQKLKLARYTSGYYARNIHDKNQSDYPNRYYAGPGYIGFTGMLVGSDIDVAYYAFKPRLAYFAEGSRPASVTIDAETGEETWTYNTVGLINYNSSTALQTRARALVSNWVLLRWKEMVEEGTLTKLYKTVGEDSRAATAYSLYQKTLREQFMPTEIDESVPGQRP